MIALKIALALIFSFFLFIGAFLAISHWIFDRVEISDYRERLKLEDMRNRRSLEKRKQRRMY